MTDIKQLKEAYDAELQRREGLAVHLEGFQDELEKLIVKRNERLNKRREVLIDFARDSRVSRAPPWSYIDDIDARVSLIDRRVPDLKHVILLLRKEMQRSSSYIATLAKSIETAKSQLLTQQVRTRVVELKGTPVAEGCKILCTEFGITKRRAMGLLTKQAERLTEDD